MSEGCVHDRQCRVSDSSSHQRCCRDLTILFSSRCDDFDNGWSLLSVDYRIDCKSSRYNSMRAVSYVMLVIFPIGVPVALGWILWRNRRALYPRNAGVVMSVTHCVQGSSVLTVRLDKVTQEVLEALHAQVRSKASSTACMTPPSNFALPSFLLFGPQSS
jgi:hypothetical protein